MPNHRQIYNDQQTEYTSMYLDVKNSTNQNESYSGTNTHNQSRCHNNSRGGLSSKGF